MYNVNKNYFLLKKIKSQQNVFSPIKNQIDIHIYQSCYEPAKIVCISYTSHLATHFCLQHNVRRFAKGDCKRKTKSILLNQKVYFKIDKKLKNKSYNPNKSTFALYKMQTKVKFICYTKLCL